jgi:hypothetical protein
VGVDGRPAFKTAVAGVKPWNPLYRVLRYRRGRTSLSRPVRNGPRCVPNTGGHSHALIPQHGPTYRFLAIREPLAPPELPGLDAAQLPFPTMTFGPPFATSLRYLPSLPQDPLQGVGTGHSPHAARRRSDRLAAGTLWQRSVRG